MVRAVYIMILMYVLTFMMSIRPLHVHWILSRPVVIVVKTK